ARRDDRRDRGVQVRAVVQGEAVVGVDGALIDHVVGGDHVAAGLGQGHVQGRVGAGAGVGPGGPPAGRAEGAPRRGGPAPRPAPARSRMTGWPAWPSKANASTSAVPSIRPLTTVLSATGFAWSRSLLGSASLASGRSPTTKLFGWLAPSGPQARRS